MIRAVIFDLDGVLVSTDELHYRAWKQLADEEGIPFTHNDNDRLRGVSRMQSLDILLERSPRPYSDEQRQQLADRKNLAYQSLLDNLTAADRLPGVSNLLRDLRARNIRLAVASCSKNALTILDKLALTDAFDAIVTGNDLTRPKPDPQLFLLAAERLAVPPSQCLVIEDAAAGIESAHRAAMPSLAIGPNSRFPPGTPTLATLAQATPANLHTTTPRA